MLNAVGHNTYLIDTMLYGPMRAACYLIQDGDDLAVIDNGTHHTVPLILETIKELGATPEQVRWVIPTHVHLDHAGGTGGLMQACTNATLVIHPKGATHMIDPSKLTAGATAVYGAEAFERDFGTLLPVDENRVIAADDGQEFELGSRTLRFIDTPGHANHHGCIYDSSSEYIFTGDTFGLGYSQFREGNDALLVATTTPVAYDPEGWMVSLDKLMALKPKGACLTHYGLIEDPQQYVDMLRASIQAHTDIALAEENNDNEGREGRLKEAVSSLLLGAANNHCGMSEADAEDIFAHDIELNAQGLNIWLVRRAKKRAAN